MGNIESVDGQSEIKHHNIMPLKVPMPDPTELEEKFAIVLVSSQMSCCGLCAANVMSVWNQPDKYLSIILHSVLI